MHCEPKYYIHYHDWLKARKSGLDSGQEKEFFFTVYRAALGLEHEADHSHLSSSKDWNDWSVTSLTCMPL